ncbi:hypothetical protein [Flavobacterium ovatum]
MKSFIYLSLILLIFSSCSSKRICGGKGGPRAVSIEKTTSIDLKNS